MEKLPLCRRFPFGARWSLYLRLVSCAIYSLFDSCIGASTDIRRFSLTSGSPLPGLSRLKYSVHISRGAAVPLSLDLMLLLLPMCRITITQLRLFIKWIPLEESAWFHRQVAYTMLFYTIVHTAGHYVKYEPPLKKMGVILIFSILVFT
jgi:NADPH oxidase